MYKVLGGDGKEYGPVTADQLRQWAAEGRINAQTKVRLDEAVEWKPFSEFPEFASAVPPLPPPVVVQASGPPAAEQVDGPAIGLIVTGILGILLTAIRVAMLMIGAGITATQDADAAGFNRYLVMGGAVGVATGILGLTCGIVIVMGGVKMRKLESHGLAFTAAVLSVIPCFSPCCIVGIPIGIWALIVLLKPDVKAAFR